MSDTPLAVTLALISTLGFGAAFVFTQFGLRTLTPWRGAAVSIPTSTLLFWCLAAFLIDPAKADLPAGALFAAVGLFFPAAVTVLNFESNRLMGPNIAGALSGLAPVFAVLLALVLLHETPRLPQLLGLAAIVGGVMLMYRGRSPTLRTLSVAALAVPLAAAVIRGAVQPIIKLGLERWPDALAATLLGYSVSSMVIVVAARARERNRPRGSDAHGVRWFAAVGVCNGLAVLLLYAALGRAPVALVAPLIASYPLITVLLSHALLKEEPVTPRLAAAVAVTVAGVVLLIVS